MKAAYILTRSFYNFAEDRITIGGVQTYIADLCRLIHKEYGILPIVFELSPNMVRQAPIQLENMIIRGFECKESLLKSANQNAFDYIYNTYNLPDSIFIISTDQMDIKSKGRNVISIQHGIAFDIPGYLIQGFWGKNTILQRIKKFSSCIKNIQRLNYIPNMVCVDYNYYNWYKTLGTISKEKNIKVITNYTSYTISKEDLEEKLSHRANKLKVLFARRFVNYRGTIVFANVIKRILEEGNLKIDVTFAGEGPLFPQIKEMLQHYNNIHFTKYAPNDSVKFHKNYDIAVVPTLYSEGTSLSLAEAMAAGCFPIATHVGGMTNMIIDGYNGRLCYPSEESLYETLHEALILDRNQFRQIVWNAYMTACTSFSHDNWEKCWTKFLNKL